MTTPFPPYGLGCFFASQAQMQAQAQSNYGYAALLARLREERPGAYMTVEEAIASLRAASEEPKP